jgi:hypothetical protein
MPWDGHNGGIWHVKNVRGRSGSGENIRLLNYSKKVQAWDVVSDGNGSYTWSDKGEIEEVQPGEEVVFITVPNQDGVFRSNGGSKQWDFGELTDTSKVTGFHMIFFQCDSFNSYIGDWDTSRVRSMQSAFDNAASFNQDISRWDTSKVWRMDHMFAFAKSFNRGISAWDTSKLTTAGSMFSSAVAFNQDLSQWCVSEIDPAPNNFSNNTPSWTEPKPVWGTCPRGEDTP